MLPDRQKPSRTLVEAHDKAGDQRKGHGLAVIIVDPLTSRARAVASTVSEAGATAVLLSSSKVLDDDSAASVPVALVAAGNETVHPEALRVVAHLKKRGFEVIAYEDGVRAWNVHDKCMPLIAGAAHLLDSAGAQFPVELRRLLDWLFQTGALNRAENRAIRSRMEEHGMVGTGSAMMEVFRLAVRFAQLSDLPALITGESGTGKELLAKAITRLDSKRKEGPFVPVNCGAVTASLAESELFGHRRGAFTGADRDRRGLVRAADGGVLFLDEIGELDLAMQAKLLRVLQEGRVLTVGTEQELPVNVRFIAATNRDLKQMVEDRKFRADLYYRLCVLHVHIPPLRDRLVDLPALVDYLLHKHRALSITGPITASADFLQALRQLDWPGNTRELENVVRQALVNHSSAGEMDLNDLPLDILRQLTRPVGASPQEPAPGIMGTTLSARAAAPDLFSEDLLPENNWNLARTMEECERRLIEAAMQHTRGNQSQTARLLGITPRSVYNKVRKYEI